MLNWSRAEKVVKSGRRWWEHVLLVEENPGHDPGLSSSQSGIIIIIVADMIRDYGGVSTPMPWDVRAANCRQFPGPDYHNISSLFARRNFIRLKTKYSPIRLLICRALENPRWSWQGPRVYLSRDFSLYVLLQGSKMWSNKKARKGWIRGGGLSDPGLPPLEQIKMWRQNVVKRQGGDESGDGRSDPLEQIKMWRAPPSSDGLRMQLKATQQGQNSSKQKCVQWLGFRDGNDDDDDDDDGDDDDNGAHWVQAKLAPWFALLRPDEH